MRTLAVASGGRDETVPNPAERRYVAHGYIKVRCLQHSDGVGFHNFLGKVLQANHSDFKHNKEDEPEIEQVRKLIDETDQRMPWVDEPLANRPDGGVRLVASNVEYPYAPDFDFRTNYPPEGFDEWAREMAYTFRLGSKSLCLRRGQLYAFEKHMAKLAEELAKMRICNYMVWYEVKVTSDGYFFVR